MNKRFTSLMTTLILSVFVSISSSAYDVEVNGIYYNLAKKNAFVTSGDNKYKGDIVIPESITVDEENYTVIEIQKNAFYGCRGLTSVTIPYSIIRIRDCVFSDCTGLTTVTIPNSVTSIGENAFSYCSSLTSVSIPNSVTSMGGWTFSNCPNLTSVTIPNSLTSIGEGTFSYCSSLTSVTIPSSVTSMGAWIFSNCYNLTSVTIPNSVTSIEQGAFSNCSNLTSVTIPNSVTSIGSNAFSGCSGLTSVTIPNSVTSIEQGAFSNCSNLTSVTIPNSVTSIANRSFYACYSLTSVIIPNSVTIIKSEAFYGCENLENIYCYAEKVPNTESDVFKDAYIEYATLHIPALAINAFKNTAPWSDFGTIKAIEETESKKCETPSILYNDGVLTFSCGTDNVEFVSEVKNADVNKYYTEKVKLTACYDISVTAMKTGYDNSDVATAKLYWLPSSGTLEGDNINTVAMRGIAIQSAGGFINISGLDNNEKVDFYAIDGKALGSAKSIDGSVSFSAKQGTVVVAKIGKESLKIAVE